ncbi:MAG: N-acetylmuramoyl-L-alanine amidase [Bacteroidota bacterium]
MLDSVCTRWPVAVPALLRSFSFVLVAFFLLPNAGLAQVDDLVHQHIHMHVPVVTTAGKQATLTFAAPASAISYNGVIVMGSATGGFERGFVRFEEAGGWSAWMPLTYLEASTSERFLAGFRGSVYRNNAGFELRFDVEAGNSVTIIDAGTFDNRLDNEGYVAQDVAPAPPINRPASQAIIPPSLIPRGEWGAESFVGSPVPLANPSYNRMTFHHAACCGASTYEEGLASVKGIQDFHQNVRGWSDIGYHFIFDQSGRIYQGRPFLDNRTNLDRAPVLAQGAHVGGFNTGNIGVAVLGCYHPPEGGGCQDTMSPALRDSVVTIFAYLKEQYGVSTENLFGHRDQGSTSCPGDNNYTLLPALRTEIEALIVSGNQPIAFASLGAMNAEDGVIQLSFAFEEVFDVASFRVDRETETTAITVYSSSAPPETGFEAMFTDAAVPSPEPVQYSLYAVSTTGTEQRLASTEASIVSPDGFLLGENYPNPAQARTTIRYYLNQDGIVSLSVYDVRGKRVASLVNTFQERNQWYTATLDTDGLANGIYFYRIQVTGFSSIIFDETRTLSVVR